MESISNPQTLSIAEVAKLVDFPAGEIKFFSWLREKGYLLQDNTPAEKYRSRKWFKLVKTGVMIGKMQTIVPVTRVTVLGLGGLDRAVKRDFPPCKPCS
jgi:phage antirepressor YoqD-like protein